MNTKRAQKIEKIFDKVTHFNQVHEAVLLVGDTSDSDEALAYIKELKIK
ncbi:MAG: hypothetical protein ACI35O_13975 [Bacillaceae bacterium]